MLKNKKGLVFGIANNHSIAWGISKQLAENGAEIAIGYQNEILLKRVKPLSKEINSKILITNLIDLYNNNNKDTLSLSINSDILLNNDIQGGSVYGSIIYDGENSIIIKAEDINSDAQYFSFANDSNQFSITNIKPGFYTFSAFEFFGGYDSTQYFSGLWEPVSRAAKFSIYPTNLEIRKHWDIKDMIIEIK